MRFFVTGATGFIGRHLCRMLIDEGHEVTALVRSSKKRSLLPASVEVITGDLSLFGDLKVELPVCDVVVHLAGVVSAERREAYFEINRDAVEDLIACLQRQRWTPRRLLFASSLAAAGPSRAGQPWTEADPLVPIDDYGAAKADAEALVSAAPFPTTSFRPPIVLGAGDAATLTLYRAAAWGFGFRVGAAPQGLSYIDVRDAARGILCMAKDSRNGSYTYYLSHPRSIDSNLLWKAIGDALGKRVTIVRFPKWALYGAMRVATLGASLTGVHNQLDEKQYRQIVAPAFECSSASLQRDLGWEAQFTLEETLDAAVRGYRAEGLFA